MYQNDYDNIDWFSKLILEWDKPQKLYIVAAGCGWSFANLLSIPGASKVIDEIRLLYSQRSWLRLASEITGDHDDIVDGCFKFVSQRGLDYLSVNFPANTYAINIALTASLPSNYEKRSDNQVFGRIGKQDFHIKFDKFFTREQCEEQIRDEVIERLKYV